MRDANKLMLGLIVGVGLLMPQTSAKALPHDPYPWCANYDSRGFGGSNCGFSTWNQCMATVSGVGGFCVPNQFYNPGRPIGRNRGARYPYHY